jgi:hypothetical protein
MKTQLRGHCPICGNQQAVKDGMSKHGYTVDGYFKGVCTGAHLPPMEESRVATEIHLKYITSLIESHKDNALMLESGELKPHTIHKYVGRTTDGADRYGYKDVYFNLCDEYDQKEAVKSAIYKEESQVRLLIGLHKYLEDLLNVVHGKPLVEITKTETVKIKFGEKRIADNGSVMTVTRLDGARVYWKNERGFNGWTGSQAWRRFSLLGE